MITRAKSGIRKCKVLLSPDTNIIGLEPTSFKQASKDPKWQEDMTEEYNTLLTNDVPP